MDKNEEIELQSAVFQRLVDHLRKETKLQNIDLMNLTGFCRNCLGKWYLEAAEERGLDIDYDTAREFDNLWYWVFTAVYYFCTTIEKHRT